MFEPFIQFSLILLIVLFISTIIRLLKQPLIIGYIVSGIVVGPLFLNLIKNVQTISVFSEMGIAFLLFIVGLHLSPKVIKEVGKVALITGLGQIIFTSVIGFLIIYLLGFNVITAIYIAIALTFSSTIIIMKLLSDKDALEKLYGKISIGFLLVQDLVAIVILIVISSIMNSSNSPNNFLFMLVLKGVLLMIVLIPVSYYCLPRLSDFFAKSQEYLFLFAISWGFGISILFAYLGFSIEVGALIAGIMLSMSPYTHEISSKLKPLRDFFIISFFIILGSQMVFQNIGNLIIPIIILSCFILIGNPLIVMILMGVMGYSKKTSFMAGLTVAQISEFSLILIALGVKTGNLNQEILSFVTVIGLITIAGSTYMIKYSDFIFNKFSRILSIFERKNIHEIDLPKKKFDYILLGYNRIGFSIMKTFKKITKKHLVIDFNPNIVKELQKEGINAIYGDVDDSGLLEELEINKAKVVVSTIPEKETNMLILEVLKREKAKTISVLTARQIEDGLELYSNGASYVIMPHFLGGEYVSKIIEKGKGNKKSYQKERKKEIVLLKERLKKGLEHPLTDKNQNED